MVAVVAALLVRLLALGLPGTVDTKAWKAWSVEAASRGLVSIYGPADHEILLAARAETRGEVLGLLTMPFPRNAFWYRGEFHVVDYPPLSMVLLFLVGKAYLFLDSEQLSGRLFNTLLNLPPFLASIGIALLLRRSDTSGMGLFRSVAFWCNPAVLLGAVLGYQDAIFGLCALGACQALTGGLTALGTALVVLSGLLKPQGSLLLPTLLALLLVERRRSLPASVLAGSLAAAVAFAPWWWNSHLLSALDGTRRPIEEATVSAQSLNLGWVAGYVLQWVHEGPFPLARILTLDEFRNWAGFDAATPSRILLAIGTLGNVFLLLRRPSPDPVRVPLSLVLQAHLYALCGTAVHENHTFLAVFVAPLLLGLWDKARAVLFWTSGFLFLNLGLLEGLGRNLVPDRRLYHLRLLTGVDLSVLVAVGHVALVVALFAWAARREPSPSR